MDKWIVDAWTHSRLWDRWQLLCQPGASVPISCSKPRARSVEGAHLVPISGGTKGAGPCGFHQGEALRSHRENPTLGNGDGLGGTRLSSFLGES